MPVEQPVRDTNYKQLKIIRIWPKKTMIKTIITIEIIVAYRGENNKMPTRKKTNKQTNKQKQNRVVGGGGGEVNREQN